jgi:60 kDa SS-A/Ro ribonucleoprotein
MGAKYRGLTATDPVPQTRPLDERQKENNAGGFVYTLPPADRLKRFLILGTEGGTYYAGDRAHTAQANKFLGEYLASDPDEYYSVLKAVNDANSAPRHSALLYALARLVTSVEVENKDLRGRIKEDFTSMVRTGTHLFEFTDYLTGLSGKWSRFKRGLVASWYTSKDPDSLAYQAVKYRQRDGWTHRDTLRLSHAATDAPGLNSVLRWMAKDERDEHTPALIREFAEGDGLVPGSRLPWEALPTEALADAFTWKALVAGNRLPLTAMLRNLGRMTSNGALKDQPTRAAVLRDLVDPAKIEKARIHPFNVLTAMKTYASGAGFRGSMTRPPIPAVIDALDEMFRISFGNVPKTDKRTLIALDVSGSMGASLANSNVSAREGSAAMALVQMAANPGGTDVIGFTSGGWNDPVARAGHRHRSFGGGVRPLTISPRQRLDDAVQSISRLSFGATDCALPMLYAAHMKEAYDAFVVYTDSETFHGGVHPTEALRSYRKSAKGVSDAALVVVGMTATEFTIADPMDTRTLDVVGFDSSAPALIGDFVAGRA